MLWTIVRWTLPVAVAFVIAAAAVGTSQVDEHVRQRVAQRLAETFPTLAVSVDAAELDEGRGIVVRGVTLVAPELPGRSSRLARIDEIRLACGTSLAELASGPPAITLITAQYSNGEGKHSALMINASERVIFDPAGSWYQPGVPERNDVLHGITPRILDIYTDFYARENQHVVMQTVEVSPEAAERALDLVQAYGAVGNARCTLSTTEILGQTPGFEDTPRRLWPQRAMREFAARPGVRTEILYGPDGRAPDPVVVWGRQGQPAAGS